MPKSDYQPHPLDTGKVRLDKSLEDLTEMLAKNVHEVWAAGRIREGWKYGPARDDRKKEHPCLIDYSKLPEVEKEHDRATAMQTLKAIVKLGYSIALKKPADSNRTPNE